MTHADLLQKLEEIVGPIHDASLVIKLIDQHVEEVIVDNEPMYIVDTEGIAWDNTFGRERNLLRDEQRERAGLKSRALPDSLNHWMRKPVYEQDQKRSFVGQDTNHIDNQQLST